MEITWLKNEDNAIQYVYASAVPQKIPLDIFKEIVQSSKENCLPEFYVISEPEEKYSVRSACVFKCGDVSGVRKE